MKIGNTPLCVVVILLALVVTAPVAVLANTADMRIIADGRATNAGPVKFFGDEMFLPLREVLGLVGGLVSRGGDSRQVIASYGHVQAVLKIGSSAAVIDGESVRLDAPVMLIRGLTMVPLQLLTDHFNLGAGITDSAVFISSRPAEQIPVLVYHHMLPYEKNEAHRSNPMVLSTESFEEQMRYLYENNFYTLTIRDMEEFLLEGRRLPERSVKIHFDDGYYSNFVYAYPILRDFGLRAAIFFITREIERKGDVQQPLSYTGITWTAAKTIRGTESVFETASHSHYMHHLTTRTPRSVLYTSSREDIIADTLKSFEFVGNHTAYVYPRNHLNARVADALREAGIVIAFGGIVGYVTENSNHFDLERFKIYPWVGMEHFQDIVNGRIRTFVPFTMPRFTR